jgi:hypothetical protein
MLDAAETPECSEVWIDEELVRLGVIDFAVIGTAETPGVGTWAERSSPLLVRSWTSTS